MATAVRSKEAIRADMEEKLALLTSLEKKLQSEEVFKKLVNSDFFKNSKRISTYLSTEKEVDTEPIVRKIIEDGNKCFVPTFSKKSMEMVRLSSMEDWETLPLSNSNIKQPSFKDKRENARDTGGLDLIIIPTVGITRDGVRLGHGGGYYDRFLAQIKETQEKPPIIVALCFKEQLFDELPTPDNDAKIDYVLYAD